MLRSFLHWKVLVNLIVALGIFTGLVWLTFRWLEFHTNHGEEVAVPNVVNMTVQQAIQVLDDQGLEYEVDSFKYDPKFKPFQVLKIYPSAGSHIKNERTIVLQVNPKTWAPVAVPNILDGYKGLAFRKLERLGLKVGDTLFEPSIQKDAVIRMMFNGKVIKPGEKVPMFSSLDFVIGSGPKRNVIVPNLVGRTVAEAKAIIAQNYFEVGLIEHEDGQNSDSDIIYYQDPNGGSVRDQGMQVDLWASKKTPAEMQGKIQQLDNIYRTVDINSVPEPSIDNGNVSEPQTEPTSAPVQKPQTSAPKPQNTTPKPQTTTTPKPQAEKPKTTTATKPAEEKQAKKIIVE